MKNIQKFSVLFRLNKQRSKNGESQIYVRFSIDGKRAEIATSIFLNPKYWDSKYSEVKNSHPESNHFSTVLSNIKSELNRDFLFLASQNQIVDINMLKNKYLGVVEKPKFKTICETFDYHNLKMKETLKTGKIVPKTLLRYEITKNKVVSFMKRNYGISDKSLPEIRLSFATEFLHYLLTVDKLQSNTANKYIKNLKKIMNLAVGLDWIPSNPLNQFKCSYVSPEREILTQFELNKIMNKEISNNRLSEVRDVFIFCCYTGFAYSEIYKFEKDSVTLGIDGSAWLSTIRAKTGNKESVPLLPIPLMIIEKYKTSAYCDKNNKLLPVNSNQRYNAYIKELMSVCEINKRITTHTARHTFATTITLSNGVPIETVSSMLGHTNIRTTQIYAKVIQKKVSEDMKLLREKLGAVGNLQIEKNAS